MFVKEAWYVAAWASEIEESGIAPRQVAGEPLVMMRASNGEIIALEDRCSHRMAPLSKGRREGDAIRCMYHGLKFDCTGTCVEVPGQDKVPRGLNIRKYPALVRHGAVWIWPGDPARANPDLIPATFGPGDPEYLMVAQVMDYDVNYQLINDNLCDLSHVAFVHENTFARIAPSDTWAQKPNFINIERGIRIERWFEGVKPPPGVQGVDSIDIWNPYDFLVPGFFSMLTAIYPAGTAAQFKNGSPGTEVEPLYTNFFFQAVTPMTEGTSRYFFASGVGAKWASPQGVQGMKHLAVAAFEEDKAMITAQSRNIERFPGRNMGAILHDRGPTRLRQLIERQIRAEQGDNAVETAASDTGSL